MKNLAVIIFLIFVCITATSQTTRYFEFRQPYNNGYTSFIAATSDTVLVGEVLSDIGLPINQRRFISGNITNTSGGINHSGTNWHTWHFIINDWLLSVANVEVCDGVSAIVGNNAIVVSGDTVYFCPWDAYPFQEVPNPALDIHQHSSGLSMNIYPNPVTQEITVQSSDFKSADIKIFNMAGQLVLSASLTNVKNDFSVNNFQRGVYTVHLTNGKNTTIKKFVKQ